MWRAKRGNFQYTIICLKATERQLENMVSQKKYRAGGCFRVGLMEAPSARLSFYSDVSVRQQGQIISQCPSFICYYDRPARRFGNPNL